MRLSLMIVATALVAAPLLAQTRTSEFDSVNQAQPIDGVTQTEDVRFRDDGNERMTVPVRLSGQGPFRFLVDTGADRTAVSRELARHLKLEPGGRASLHSVTGVSFVETAKVPSLQLTQKAMRVANAALLNSSDMGADGILGIDSLKSQRVMFDFRTDTMSIVPSAVRVMREEKGTIVVRARERNGRLILSQAVADGERVAVVLDTGSELTVGNNALRRRLFRSGGRNIVDRMGQVELRSVTGAKLTGEYIVVRRLEIGGVTLVNLAIVFADAHTFRQLKMDDRPAVLLGMNALRAFEKVSIDFANKKLRLVLPEHSDSRGIQFAGGLRAEPAAGATGLRW